MFLSTEKKTAGVTNSTAGENGVTGGAAHTTRGEEGGCLRGHTAG